LKLLHRLALLPSLEAKADQVSADAGFGLRFLALFEPWTLDLVHSLEFPALSDSDDLASLDLIFGLGSESIYKQKSQRILGRRGLFNTQNGTEPNVLRQALN